ncbi:RNA-binding S4 domain-containing protein [Varunaivibrio sulfuroxidans]|uniref:Heat shock protein Hsp15 n=1 Tax=Varunaivibrio sulfuroxidans TaxID=1773489 RepID=A0A4R3JC86_9PROT|nr:RNA-binding S4 domain-containing protein [Varunaivibrio sulfuroxidans]TCS63659.1 heat shock protein Hsp15 [Varunaivibrio sulfuroxidans]WES30203.1 RNA-binding S4 domain-containing protein [Varunaivibrio sulfuroxidans]
MNTPPATIRLDKWLWQARFFKSRARATQFCHAGNVRRASSEPSKAHYALKIGDILTFTLNERKRIIEVVALGARRGPAPEAQSLYIDHSPQEDARAPGKHGIYPSARRDPGAGRPTKAERRAIDRLKDYD